MGDDGIYKGAYEKLTQNMDNFHSALTKTFEIYSDCQNHYRNSMQTSLDRVEYFDQGEFMNLHQNTKNEAISQVWKPISVLTICGWKCFDSIFFQYLLTFKFMDTSHVNDAIKFMIRSKLDSNIEEHFHNFTGKNVAKHADFIVSIEWVNQI